MFKHQSLDKKEVREEILEKAVTKAFFKDEIVETNENTIETPTITILGMKMDKLVVLLYSAGIIVLTLMFFALGLFKMPGNKRRTVLILYFVSVAFLVEEMIYTKPVIAETQLELNLLGLVTNHVLALLGPIVLLIAFSKLIPIYYSTKLIYILIGACILLSVTCLYLSNDHSATSYRAIRIFKQVLYNISVIMLIVFLVLVRPLAEDEGSSQTNPIEQNFVSSFKETFKPLQARMFSQKVSPVPTPMTSPIYTPVTAPLPQRVTPKLFPKSSPRPSGPVPFKKSKVHFKTPVAETIPSPSVSKSKTVSTPMTVDEYWNKFSI